MGLSDAIERLLGGAPTPNVSTASRAHDLAGTPDPDVPVTSEPPAAAAGGESGDDPTPPRAGEAVPSPGLDEPVAVSDSVEEGDVVHDVPSTTDTLSGAPVDDLLVAAVAEPAELAVTGAVDLPLAESPVEVAPSDAAAEVFTFPPALNGDHPADAPLPDVAARPVGWDPAPPRTVAAVSTDDTFPAAWSPLLEAAGAEVEAGPDGPGSEPAEIHPATSESVGPLNGAGALPSPDDVPGPPETIVDPPSSGAWSPTAAEPEVEPPPDVVPAPYEWDPPLPPAIAATPSADASSTAWDIAVPERPVADVLPPAADAAPPIGSGAPAPEPHAVPFEPTAMPFEPTAMPFEAGAMPFGPAIDGERERTSFEPESIDGEPETGPGMAADAADGPGRPVPELPVATGVGFEQLEATATIVESLGLGYHLGSAIERIVLSEARGIEGVPSLREAIWLIERHIELARGSADAETLAAIRGRLVRNGDVIAGLQALSVAVDARRSGAPMPAPPAPPATSSAPAPSAAPARPAPRDEPVGAPDGQPSLLADALRRTPPAPEHDDIEEYPLGRELLVMAVRFGLILVVIVVVVLVITLAATLT